MPTSIKTKTSKTTGCFDINLSCSGYIYALACKAMIQSDQAKTVLLITSDTYSKFITKRTKNRVLFGDGSTGTLVTSEKKNAIFSLGNSSMGTDGTGGSNWFLKTLVQNMLSKKIEKLEMDGPVYLSLP